MGIYFGDLHNHCGITYGFGSLENALEEARRHLDFCACTGHAMWPDMPSDSDSIPDYIAEYHKVGFKKLADNWDEVREIVNSYNTTDFVTFQGYEMHSGTYGDYHVISPDEDLKLLYAKSPQQLIEKIRKTNFAIAIPHHMGYIKGYRGINWEEFDENISPIVEVFSRHGCAMDDDSAYPYYHTMGPRVRRGTVFNGLNKGHKFSFAASTDHHAGYPGSYGDGRIAVIAQEKTREKIWQSIINGHTYAVTGDKIKCDFSINGHIMGSRISGKGTREIKLSVTGCDAVDKITVYKNSNIWKTEAVTPIEVSPNSYKVRIELGWGDKAGLTHWNCEINVKGGTILSYEPCFRGIGVLAPAENQSSQDDINKLNNKVYDVTQTGLKFCCSTVKNDTTLNPQTSCVIFEISSEKSISLSLFINGIAKEYSLAELCQASEGFFIGGFTSPAVLVHKAVPDTLYKKEFIWYDEPGEEKEDYYYCEIRQRNMQFAWISPIFVKNIT